MSLELGQFVRAKQDWWDHHNLVFSMGDVAQVIGFTLNSGTVSVYLEFWSGVTEEFPVSLFAGVWEHAPSHTWPSEAGQGAPPNLALSDPA